MSTAYMSSTEWSAVPMVFIPRPPRVACPHPGCGREGHIIVRSYTEPDGSAITRRVICRHCSRPFLVVVDADLPAAGIETVWPL